MDHFTARAGYGSPDEPLSIKQCFAAAAVVATLVGLLVFAPARDASKVVSGLPCSVLSENSISAVIGLPMRLMPSSGTVCQYVSTSPHLGATVFVIANHDQQTLRGDTVPVPGIGSSATRTGGMLSVRSAGRAYTFNVVPHDSESFTQELALAHMMQRTVVAKLR